MLLEDLLSVFLLGGPGLISKPDFNSNLSNLLSNSTTLELSSSVLK